MLTYFSAVWAGESDPLWPHVVLLSISIVAAFAVGAGILLESPKYSAAVHKVATWLVLGGIAVESLCTVLLFVFDERISSRQDSTIASQQFKIIALQSSTDEATKEAAHANERAAQLEKDAAIAQATVAGANARAAEATQKAAEAQLALERLKTPRTLRPERQQAIVAATAPFRGQRYGAAISQGADDGIGFWESLYSALEQAGWVYMPATMGMGNPVAGIPIAAIPGVEIVFDLAKEQELAPAALALGNALHADGMVVAVNRTRQSNPNEAERNVLQIVIGARVPPP